MKLLPLVVALLAGCAVERPMTAGLRVSPSASLSVPQLPEDDLQFEADKPAYLRTLFYHGERIEPDVLLNGNIVTR